MLFGILIEQWLFPVLKKISCRKIVWVLHCSGEKSVNPTGLVLRALSGNLVAGAL